MFETSSEPKIKEKKIPSISSLVAKKEEEEGLKTMTEPTEPTEEEKDNLPF